MVLSALTGEPFLEIATLLAVAAAGGALALLLRQPLLVSFLAVGILVGPSALGLVRSTELVETLAELGIALLLFVVGLKIDPRALRLLGPVAAATGIGQIVFTASIGYLLAWGLGLSPLAALYVAVALTFSSTAIIVKLLADKREVDTLHGRIAIGFLIVQDVFVILVLVGLSLAGLAGAQGDAGTQALLLLGQAALFVVAMVLAARFVLPPLLRQLARSNEMLVLFGIAWAVALGGAGVLIGIGAELGAFLAGLSLATTAYREAIGSRIVSLRDFMLLFFFIHLGAQLDLGLLGAMVLPAVVLSVFVLVGNPVIVMAIMGFMGYRSRTGFLAGLTVAQISEFSLVLGAAALALGHIDAQAMGLITLVGLVTISLSTYMILYSHPLYRRLEPLLGVFERRDPWREDDHAQEGEPPPQVVLFGLGRYGMALALALMSRGMRVLAVDADPQAVRRARRAGTQARFGDAEDPEFLHHLPLAEAKWVVSTIPDVEVNRSLLSGLRDAPFSGRTAVTAHTDAQAKLMDGCGADRVLRPFMDAAAPAAESLAERDADQ